MPATLRSLIAAAEARDLNMALHRVSADNQSYLLAMHRGMVPAETVRRATPVVTCDCGQRATVAFDELGSGIWPLCEECITALDLSRRTDCDLIL